jgi:class 3 adenylate cyclase
MRRLALLCWTRPSSTSTPKELTERLLATRGQVGKERQIVTMVLSDVKGSAVFAEALDPEE